MSEKAVGYVLALFGLAGCAWAQGITGSVSGNVVDPSAAVIPSAQVTLKSTATGASQTVSSNAAGRFVFPGVAAGAHDLQISAKGFQTYVRERIDVTAGEIRDVGSIALALGETSETIKVVDTPAVLQMASGEVSTVSSGPGLPGQAHQPDPPLRDDRRGRRRYHAAV
jgi:hypothetical protein